MTTDPKGWWFFFAHFSLRIYNQKLLIFSVANIKQNDEIPKKKYVKIGYIIVNSKT